MKKWTVVQHSAKGYANDSTFKHGLETRSLRRKDGVDKVRRAGGVIFDTYKEAVDYAFEEMYRNVNWVHEHFTDGLVPKAPGAFSSHTVDGLKIYVPVENALKMVK